MIEMSQGCDSGRWYCEDEEIEKAMNKYVTGIIYDDIIPDYWIPNLNAKWTVDELLEQGYVEIRREPSGPILILSDKFVEMLRSELRREEEEKKREEERRIEHMEFDSFVTIHDDEGNVIETIKIIGD